MEEKPRVAVLGAGIAGLMAVKGCLEEGLDPICFEQDEQIGGIWYYTENQRSNQGAASFQSLITNTSKETTCTSDFPLPDDAPEFLTHERFQQYLLDMSQHFGLVDHIQFNTTVVNVRSVWDLNQSGRWQVDVRKKGSSDVISHLVDRVVVCIGGARKARLPDIPGLDTFTGKFLHMIDYRVPSIFKDKRVLIVGNQNSAGDACADAGRNAKQAFWSVGDGAWLMSRVGKAGTPYELAINRCTPLVPRKIMGFSFRMQAFDTYIDQRQYGLGHKRNPGVGGPFLLNEELLYLLKSGRVIPKPNLIRVSGKTAHFSDGSEVECDVILAATGYRPDFSLVDLPEIQGDVVRDMSLYKWTFPIREGPPTIALIGAAPSLGARVPYMELQGRWIARIFCGKCQLPSIDFMKKSREKTLQFFKDQCDGKLLELALPLQESLAEEFGARPRFWSLLLKTWSPWLLRLVFLGPALPVHYRLQGPGSLPDAPKRCYESYHRAFHTPSYRRSEGKTQIYSWFKLKLFALALVAIGIAVMIRSQNL